MNLLSALPLLAALAAPGGDETTVTFAFGMEEGGSLSKYIQTDQYQRLDRITLIVDGNPQSPEQSLEIATTQILRVTDEYGPVQDGHPLSIRRVYDRIGFSGAAEVPTGQSARSSRTMPLAGKSGLEGASVVNTWVPELGEYGRYYDREDPPEIYLRNLRSDMDFRVLLPAAPVEKDERWELAPGSLIDVLACGGALPYELDTAGDPSMHRLLSSGVGGQLADLFPAETVGKAHAVCGGTRLLAEGEVEVGVILFEFELELDCDQTEEAAAALTVIERSTGVEVTGSRTKTLLSGRGELLWHLAEGRAHSLSLTSTSRIERVEKFEAPTQLRRGSVERQMSLNGQITIKADFQPAN